MNSFIISFICGIGSFLVEVENAGDANDVVKSFSFVNRLETKRN